MSTVEWALLRLDVADDTKARELARYVEHGQFSELARELEQVLMHRDAIVIARAFELVRDRREERRLERGAEDREQQRDCGDAAEWDSPGVRR